MRKELDLMFDANVRVERVIYIAGAVVDPECTPEEFSEEFCENLPSRPDMSLYSQLPVMARFATGEEWPEPVEVAEALSGVPGFLVQAATPFFKYDTGGQSASFHWGHYYTEWLYAPSESAIAALCAEWAEARHSDDKAKAA